MITPSDIRKKGLAYWDNQKFLKADITDEPFFPLLIPFRKVSAKQLLEDYESVRRGVMALKEGSKAQKGIGYDLTWKDIAHRKLGTQPMVEKIVIPSKEDYLHLIGKEKEYREFCQCFEQITTAQPGLKAFLTGRPQIVFKYITEWPELLKVCGFFQKSPRPDRYIRELDIPGVDTKFIETHKPILKDLLDEILPEDAIDTQAPGSGTHAFENRFYLKYDMPVIRFRILDTSFVNDIGYSDISVPLNEFKDRPIPVNRIFITENKINGLTFPEMEKSMVIFGLGYGIQSLKNISWLKNKDIFYWGDIDTHGFSILSIMRGMLPQTQSFLMDENTLFHFKNMWVEEPSHKRTTGALSHLTWPESELYNMLTTNQYGENIRLEQERISFGYVWDALKTLFIYILDKK